MRWDDFTATMSSGPRSGQRVMEQVNTRLVEKGLKFLQARADDGTCAPGRASLLTGNWATNHGIGAQNSADQYYSAYRQGKRWAAGAAGVGKSARWIGPWEFDRAKQNGYADTSVAPASQGTVGGIVTVTGFGIKRANDNLRGDNTTPDDLQAFTGSVPNWLRHNGVRCGLIGKYQNAYGDYDARYPSANERYLFVPPGWNYWAALIGDDDGYNGGAQDHWRVHTCEYSGPNSGSGSGAVGVEVAYRYDIPISTITWAAGTVTVTLDSSYARPHRLQVGKEVSIEGVSPTGYNSAVNAAGHTVTGIVSDYVFTYALALNPGGAGANGVGQIMFAYPQTQYGDRMWGERGVDFVNGCSETEPWYLFINPDNPHQGTVGTAAVDSRERERRYMGSVAAAGFAFWGGISGTVSPAVIAANATSGRKEQWRQRQDMLASTDDAIGMVLDACEARGWHNVIVVLTSDNGFQVGEQEAVEGASVWDSLGGKGFVYDGSVRLPFIVRHPLWAKNATSNLLVSQSDVPLTVLDWFGLTTHHAHDKRDGYSIQRLLADGNHAYSGRAQLIIRGEWQNAKSEGLIDTSLKKLVRHQVTPATRALWDRADDIDYEMTDVAASNAAQVTAMAARLDVLRDARWNGTTNNARTG